MGYWVNSCFMNFLHFSWKWGGGRGRRRKKMMIVLVGSAGDAGIVTG